MGDTQPFEEYWAQCFCPRYGGSIQGLAQVPEGQRLADQGKEAWGGGVWIDLYRNEHENVKTSESYVTHRNHLKRCCPAKYGQNDSAKCPCASAFGLGVGAVELERGIQALRPHVGPAA